MAITQEAVDFYHDNGYYLYREPVFNTDKFQRLSDIFEELLESRGDKRPDELNLPHFDEPRLLEFLLADEVVDLVEPFIGPDIALWASHFICKEPRTGRASPWHEDSHYWKGRFETFPGIVTIWLAIDPADRENGCMKVIPGTHTDADGEYEKVDHAVNTFGSRIKAVDESKTVYFELKSNQCSFHDARIVHGADPNQSDRRRCGYTMRYFSQQMRLNTDFPRNRTHRMWHCRGRNLHNNPMEN